MHHASALALRRLQPVALEQLRLLLLHGVDGRLRELGEVLLHLLLRERAGAAQALRLRRAARLAGGAGLTDSVFFGCGGK